MNGRTFARPWISNNTHQRDQEINTMGMDVIGVAPSSETGAYFRNNVWWWRPLAHYLEQVCMQAGRSDLYNKCEYWHTNDGDGLDGDGSRELAGLLEQELSSGATLLYEQSYMASLARLPRTTCDLCNGTGVRSDEVGREKGMPDRVIAEEGHPRNGQTGWCNGCNGVGTQENFQSHYPFSAENVHEFVAFLKDCGGFRIC